MDRFDPKEIAKFIDQAKVNTGFSLTRDEAIDIMTQIEADRYEAANTPSDRDMHRAGFF